jgi:hypothetical protein
MDVLTLRLAVCILGLTAVAAIVAMTVLALHTLPESQGLTAAVSGAIGGILGLVGRNGNGKTYQATPKGGDQ